MASAFGDAWGSSWGDAWGAIAQAMGPATYAPTKRKLTRAEREKRLGGQYVQLEQVEAKPVPVEQIQAKQQSVEAEQARLTVLLLAIEQQLAIEQANAQAFDALLAQQQAAIAQQAALQAQLNELATLAAYEALMRRIDEQDIEMLLLAI